MADLSWLETKSIAALNTSMPTSFGGWQQSRESRGYKPVEFYAFELTADYEPPTSQADTSQEPEMKADEPKNTKPDPPPNQGIGADEKYQEPEIDKPP